MPNKKYLWEFLYVISVILKDLHMLSTFILNSCVHKKSVAFLFQMWLQRRKALFMGS